MEIDELPENDERLLKKGRFEQAGTGLIKKSQVIKKPKHGHGGLRAGAGRPRGSKNKISLALKEMILESLDEVGGVEYLKRLAIENSSAYASLLGKVLPATLDTSGQTNGRQAKIVFERVVVWPDGRREVEGVTPKQLPPPASHTLPSEHADPDPANKINDLD